MGKHDHDHCAVSRGSIGSAMFFPCYLHLSALLKVESRLQSNAVQVSYCLY